MSEWRINSTVLQKERNQPSKAERFKGVIQTPQSLFPSPVLFEEWFQVEVCRFGIWDLLHQDMHQVVAVIVK